MIPDVNKEQNFYYLFKKYEFRAFNNVFKHYSKQKNAILGTGESINKEYLAFAMKKKCKLLFCKRDEPRAIYTPDRNMLKTLQNIRHPKAIYTGVLTVNILKDFCEDNGLIRVQDKTNEYKTNDYTDATILVNEETYSFPDKLLMRYDDVQTKLTKVVA
ncbi:MAG: hypothetical protein KAS04_04885 [Candidatus Aenigmarchaeota archaeon]|nr:hypothetical protein [Candidatus Aenigmarchaeota archaeon]